MTDITVADSPSFHYVPPPAAHGAQRVIVKPNLGYPVPAPVTVGLPVLREVLLGIRRVAPRAEIVILEGVCTRVTFAEVMARLGVNRLLAELDDPGLRLLDADTLPHKTYSNTFRQPQRFDRMQAPALLEEADCRVSVAGFKRTTLKGRPLISAAIKNLYGLFPRAVYRARSPHARGQLHVPDVQRILVDVYFTLGVRFEGAVVDLTHKFISRDWQPDEGTAVPVGRVVTGTDLLDVDLRAVELAGEPCSDYFQTIARQRRAG
ncbi:DUF362 domain-containing protein [Chloracidobacterium thermophilum]|uniref:DUF362 domain-containing protein n=1 Tax=Chloracidobacterium thermophilum (strain B) TaxID=981222 RepID=G2LHS9_CHLTF|nr:DUF362 domain-containing protein [Chloracidobacterium thermophilum]AEP10989.1 hypothetical protein Cabther_A0217 [Chloracidobacterium thermophilum B]QUV78914.1 DUF362 domain-containing protein [Chloracidobacterium thermophilum]